MSSICFIYMRHISTPTQKVMIFHDLNCYTITPPSSLDFYTTCCLLLPSHSLRSDLPPSNQMSLLTYNCEHVFFYSKSPARLQLRVRKQSLQGAISSQSTSDLIPHRSISSCPCSNHSSPWSSQVLRAAPPRPLCTLFLLLHDSLFQAAAHMSPYLLLPLYTA